MNDGDSGAFFKAIIHAIATEMAPIMAPLVAQELRSAATQRYATSKSNPLGNPEAFLAAAAKGRFKAHKVGRTVRALWSDVEAYVATLPVHKRKGVLEANPDYDAMLADSAKRKRPTRGE